MSELKFDFFYRRATEFLVKSGGKLELFSKRLRKGYGGLAPAPALELSLRASLRCLPALGMAGENKFLQLAQKTLRLGVTSAASASQLPKPSDDQLQSAVKWAEHIDLHAATLSDEEDLMNVAACLQGACRAALKTASFAITGSSDDLADTVGYAAILPSNLIRCIEHEKQASKWVAAGAKRHDDEIKASDLANELDYEALRAGANSILKKALWGKESPPTDAMKEAILRLRRRLQSADEIWRFWDDWYQGFLDGAPLDWELQRRVAMIADASWKKGPKHVAAVIEDTRKRFELETLVAKLQAERGVAFVREARLGIGGNSPPEEMQIQPQLVKEISMVWNAIDELKKEIAAETPDKGNIARIVDTLSRGLLAIMSWCGSKVDLSIDTLIKWGVPIGAASLAANTDTLKAVIQAAKAWLDLF